VVIVKSGYVIGLLLSGVAVFALRAFGNPFSPEANYRIEYTGKIDASLWGSYTITQNDRLRSRNTEKVIGQLPRTISFNAPNNAIVSANGSMGNKQNVNIKIYKNGVECSSSSSVDSGVTDTIVCR
jgi:hypothetical protein